MKRVIIKSLFVFFIMLSSNCIANCSGEEIYIPCPKTYISPNQVTFSENEIFVHINDMQIRTEYLRTDAQGIFFETARENDCGFAQWKCERKIRGGLYCNTCNWAWESSCRTCGNER